MGARALKSLLVATLGLAMLGVVVAWMSGLFSSRIAPGFSPVGVQATATGPTETVLRVEESVFEEVPGTVRPRESVQIGSKLLAAVEEITVSSGDAVEKGQLLVRLDDRDQVSRLEQARQALSASEASLAQARAEHERYRSLLKQKSATRSAYDSAEAEALAAQAQVNQLAEAVEEAKVALSYTRIVASAAGQVISRLIEPGDTISPGQPIMTLHDPASLRLEAPVREGLATQLQKGQRLKVRLETLDAEAEGVVEEIVPQAEVATRTFLVKVALVGREGLMSGMFARLLVPAGTRTRYCAPVAAIERAGQLEFAHVVDETGHVERRLVRTGEHSEHGKVEVLSGLRPGDRVVLLTRNDAADGKGALE